MTKFLDILAMEAAEWSYKEMYEKELDCWMVTTRGNLTILKDGFYYIKDHWLQRRKELINEPDDSEAPKWALWKAQDEDGLWYWYRSKPAIDETVWSDENWSNRASEGKIPAGHDWKQTLKEVVREPKGRYTLVMQELEKEIKEVLDVRGITF